MLFAVCGIVFSFSVGFIGKYTTQVPILILTLAVSAGICVFILAWTPHPNNRVPIYLISFALSFTRSVTTGQVRGLCALIFNKPNINLANLFILNRLVWNTVPY